MNLEKKLDFAAGELLLVDKPVGWTSFDVVNKIRYSLRPAKIKVGHAGTLDPLATGLLIICTGKFTKKIDTYQAEAKEYTGTITLGATTPSYDLETEVDARYDASGITEDAILDAAQSLTGDILQLPPAHSAIKQQGERIYEKARRGEHVTLTPRPVTVYKFEITNVSLPEVHFCIQCSKGTYIRSLAHDLGQILGCGGHLSSLRRTGSGSFRVEDAWQIDELIRYIKSENQA